MANQEFDGEVIFYQPDDNINLEVRLSEETDIVNALKKELAGISTVAKFATTAT